MVLNIFPIFLIGLPFLRSPAVIIILFFSGGCLAVWF